MVTDEKQALIDAVIEDLKKGFEVHDYTVLDELLGFVPTKRLIHSLPEEDWVKFTPPKFVPYIVEDLKVLHNGITEHIRKKYRTRTVYDWMPPKISFGNYSIEWLNCFDSFGKDYWVGAGYLGTILTDKKEIPMEYHYGNSSAMFLMNLIRHFPTKELLLENIEKWCNYYRKHVTDNLSGLSATMLGADIMLQRSGLSAGIKQEYHSHTLAEIETGHVKEYYYIKYEIHEDHILFYTNAVYPSWAQVKVIFKT